MSDDLIGDIAQTAAASFDRSRLEKAERLYARAIEVTPQGSQALVCEAFLNAFALEAARSMDAGQYGRVIDLSDSLPEVTAGDITPEEVKRAFHEEGAALHLLPSDVLAGHSSIFVATKSEYF